MNYATKEKWLIYELCKPVDQWHPEFKDYLAEIILITLESSVEDYKQYVEIHNVNVVADTIIIVCTSQGDDYKLTVNKATYLADNWKEYLEVDVCNKAIRDYDVSIHQLEGQLNFYKSIATDYRRKLAIAESKLGEIK